MSEPFPSREFSRGKGAAKLQKPQVKNAPGAEQGEESINLTRPSTLSGTPGLHAPVYRRKTQATKASPGTQTLRK